MAEVGVQLRELPRRAAHPLARFPLPTPSWPDPASPFTQRETEAGEAWRPAGVTSHRGGVAPYDTQRPRFPAQGQDSMTHTSKGADLHLLSTHCLSPGLQISRPPSPLSAGLGPRTPGLSRGRGGGGKEVAEAALLTLRPHLRRLAVVFYICTLRR